MGATVHLRITLVSDATFARGDGVAGEVDQEIDHDRDGFPRINGKRLNGLLKDEGANILYGLSLQTVPLPAGVLDRWLKAHTRLFGMSGSHDGSEGAGLVRTANMPEALRRVVRAKLPKPRDVLRALTTVVRQTAIDHATRVPATGSLRSARAALRTLWFESDVPVETATSNTQEDELAWLSACVLALRRAGLRRTRGRGRVACMLHSRGADVTREYFGRFKESLEVQS